MTSLHDAAAAQFDALLSFHRRVERQLAALAALPTELALRGPGPETTSRADAVIMCFDKECVRRHAEEEHDLWPLFERCIEDGSARSHFRAVRRQLAEQHRDIEHAWRTVRRPLQAVAEGLGRRLDQDAIWSLRMLFSVHIHAEEATLHRVATGLAEFARH